MFCLTCQPLRHNSLSALANRPPFQVSFIYCAGVAELADAHQNNFKTRFFENVVAAAVIELPGT